MPRLLRLLIASALLSGAGFAHAQYSWIGENGVRHFSDRPPPAATPPNRILKAPRHAMPVLVAPRTAAAPEPQPAVTVAAPAPVAIPDATRARLTPSLAAREAAYRGREQQRAEDEKKQAQDAQRKRDIAERCENARQAKSHAESGMRVGKIEANGERGFLTDEEKAANAARANRVLADCR